MNIISRSEAKAKGYKRYFTGDPCKYGHVSERWTAGGKCLSCHYEKNPLTPVKKLSEEEKVMAAKARSRRWYEKNKDKAIASARLWKANNKDAVRKSEAKWRRKTKSKAIVFMRDSLRRVLKIEKNGRTEDILGYTRSDLVSHIESQFTKGMSWENHGEWHIDHVTSISEMLDSGITCPREINCLSNLMPIWAEENRKKHAKRKFLI